MSVQEDATDGGGSEDGDVRELTAEDRQDKLREMVAMAEADSAVGGVPVPVWMDERQRAAALALSLGLCQAEAAEVSGVNRSTVSRWLSHPERGADFKGVVNQLTMNTGVAVRPERMRRIKRLLDRMEDEPLSRRMSRHDEVDLLRLAREEGMDVVQLPAAVQAGRGVFVGVAVNVHDLVVGERENTVMSARPTPEPSGGAVEGEMRELEDGSADPGG